MFAVTARIEVPFEPIVAFCERWSITKLALFGSVLRDGFGPESDIDVLAEFGREATKNFFALRGQTSGEQVIQQPRQMVRRR